MRINKLTLILFCLALVAMSVGVMAQETLDPDYTKRVELAKKMHEVRPMNVQIDDAIVQLSKRYPEDKRALFIAKMTQTFDREALTEVSVNAMAETFTAAELEKMIDFHGSPEGKSIADKMVVYQSLVEPEMIKKIDKALMELRTGKAAE